jgi:hypothetical protein
MIDDTVHVRMNHQLWSGRLLLRPGPGYGSERQLEGLAAMLAEEAKLFSGQLAAAQRPLEPGSGTVASQQMTYLVEGIKNIGRQAFVHKRKLGVIKAARAMGLSVQAPSEPLLKAYAATHPAAGRARYYSHWTLFWPLESFAASQVAPDSDEVAEGPGAHGPGGSVPGSRNGMLPGGTLAFMLACDVFAQPRVRYSLLVFRCSRQGVPQVLLRWIAVPSAAAKAGLAAAASGAAGAAAAGLKRRRDSESPGPSGKLARSSSMGRAGSMAPEAAMNRQQSTGPAAAAAGAAAAPSPSASMLPADSMAIPAAAMRSDLSCVDSVPELMGVMQWCRRRMAYERLLHELLLLHVPLQERLLLRLGQQQEHQVQHAGANGNAAAAAAAAEGSLPNGKPCDGKQASPAAQQPTLPAGAEGTAAAQAAGGSEAEQWPRHIRLTGLPGMQLPQQLPMSGPGAGIQQVDLHSGAHGRFWVTVKGRLYCNSAPSTSSTGAFAGASSGDASSSGHSSSSSSSSSSDLKALLGLATPAVVEHSSAGLVLCYCLQDGHSSPHVVKDLLQLARGQELLDRLQALALGSQRLQLLQPSNAAATAAVAPAGLKAGQRQGTVEPADGELLPAANGAVQHLDAAKQEPGASAAGAAAANGAVAPPARPGRLLWSWPMTGTIVLEKYSLTRATLHCYPPAPAAAAAAAEMAQPPVAPPGPPVLSVHLSWDIQLPTFAAAVNMAAAQAARLKAQASQGPAHQLASHVATSSAALSAATAAAAPSPGPHASSPGPAALRAASPAAHQQGSGGAGAGPQHSYSAPSARCRIACEPALPPAVVSELQLMVQLREEGVLLDALAVAAEPLAAVARATTPEALLQQQLLPCHVRVTCLDGLWHVQVAVAAPGKLQHLIGLRPASHGHTYLTLAVPWVAAAVGGSQQAQQQQQQDSQAVASQRLQQFSAQLKQEQQAVQQGAVGMELMPGRGGLVDGGWVRSDSLHAVLSLLLKFIVNS